MLDFVAVGPSDALASGHGAAVVVAGSHEVALFRIDNAVYAMEAWCLRCGAGLADGSLTGPVLACPRCDWRYDLTTGSVLGLPALRLHTFDARVIDGQIVVADE